MFITLLYELGKRGIWRDVSIWWSSDKNQSRWSLPEFQMLVLA